MTELLGLLFLLLPVAAASGWWVARRAVPPARRSGSPSAPEFFRGINYLLDEQPDKAIDVFLKLAEVDGETVETHLALGSLFRRRGEADRAIRIHQNLVARNTLSTEQRGYALYELGQDYMRAGLLDRAEVLFRELAEIGLQPERALRGLLDIYQQERDWRQCLEIAERLKPFSERPLDTEIAQYHCELAEEARRRGDAAEVRRDLERALEVDPQCVRASIIAGQVALEAGDGSAALALFLEAADRGARYVPEVLPDLIRTLDVLRAARSDTLPDRIREVRGEGPGRTDVVEVLERLLAREPSGPLVLALSDEQLRAGGADLSARTLTDYLERHVDPAALERLLDLESRERALGGGEPARRAEVVHRVVRYLAARQSPYQCDHCGFSARSLHWQCPSCKRWGTVHPVQPERIPGDEVLRERRIA